MTRNRIRKREKKPSSEKPAKKKIYPAIDKNICKNKN